MIISKIKANPVDKQLALLIFLPVVIGVGAGTTGQLNIKLKLLSLLLTQVFLV